MPDLFTQLPALGRVCHPLLTGRRIALVGISAILRDHIGYYFEVNRPRYWGRHADGTVSVGIGGIGGSIEPGESPLSGLRREVQEELGVQLRLETPDRTALVQDWELVDWLHLPPSGKHPTPYIVNLLPPRLGGADTPDFVAIVTFLGRPRGRPRRGDLFGLLTVHDSALEPFFARDEWPLAEAEALPGLSLELAEPLPEGCALQPVLTARALRLLVRQGLHEPTPGHDQKR